MKPSKIYIDGDYKETSKIGQWSSEKHWDTDVEYQLVQPLVDDWIDVNTRLPNNLDRYSVCLANSMVTEMSYNYVGEYWFIPLNTTRPHEKNPVTHWKPLPPPPSKK